MRNAFFIFVIGFLLGSTLGIGGLYTQVVKPAGEEFAALEEEHGILKSSLDQATSALRSAAAVLRGEEPEDELDDALDISPTSAGMITGTRPTTSSLRDPETTTATAEGPDTPVRRIEYASRLERLAQKLDTETRPRESTTTR